MRRSRHTLLLLLIPTLAFASTGEADGATMIHLMTRFVMQLGVIIFASRIGGDLARKVRLPSVIGELGAGILLGPSLLGAIGFPGFADGLFPHPPGSILPVSPELYAIATVASIILLFNAGLETDLTMLWRFSGAGLAVGIGGVVVSFALGAGATALATGRELLSPLCLFMGAISTATSVGVTARILQESRRLDSPEGVTILTGAVIDDVIGIIVLAVVLGLHTAVEQAADGHVGWGRIGMIAFRAVSVWIGFTALGLLFSDQIASFLKRFGSITTFSILALGMSLLIAGLFEKAGLAMIIGAYVMGLTLSRTDIHYVVESELRPLQAFFVPVFFTVTGMFVDVQVLLSPPVLLFGLVYAASALAAKVLGCGIPALFVNFNRLGALRIGLGMAPRSEVALIIASTGLSYHILNESAFGATVMMVLISVLLTPPLLASTLRDPRRGTRKDVRIAERVSVTFNFPNVELTDMLSLRVIDYFRTEGFFINSVEGEYRVYHLNKDRTHVAFVLQPESFVFEMAEEDTVLVRTLVYEALLELHNTIGALKNVAKPESMRRELVKGAGARRVALTGTLHRRCISTHLKAATKDEALRELVYLAYRSGRVTDENEALRDVIAREKTMSTGMQFGIAIPHAKTETVTEMTVAVGLKPEGIDFQSIDGQPSTIFILVLSPKAVTGPHIRFLADISALLHTEQARERLLACKTPAQVVSFFEGR